MARPQSEECEAILAELRAEPSRGPAGMTSADVARRLMLSRHAASKHLHRMADRGQAEVIGRRCIDGVDKPVLVYRAVEVDLVPSGTLMESLHRAIQARRKIRDEGA